MVRPVQRRAVVAWAREAYRLSERRACRAVGIDRSFVRYRSIRPPQEALRKRLKELASVRVRAGYKQLHVFLRREGWPVNHKRVYRLYTEEGLTLKRRRPKRHRSASVRKARPLPSAPNQQWAMDFMHDTLADGGTVRVFTAIDLGTRECVALRAAKGFTGANVAAILSEAGAARGKLPSRIRVDNGTEFTSRVLDHWAYWNQVALDFSRPGKPVDNCFIESFNGTVRRECLSQHWFTGLEDAQRTLDAWREDYNNTRPHRSLANQSPAKYRGGGYCLPDRARLGNSLT
jgi:putative transposase